MAKYGAPGGQFGVAPMASVSAAEPESKLVFGVGFQYAQEGNGPISIASICKGGSAEQQSKIQVGDEIEAVEEISVMGKTIAELNLLLRGEIGSYVNIRLRRSKNDGTVMSYDVSLMRGQAEAFLMRERQRLQAQLENDRKQLNFAQVENEALSGALQRMQTQSNNDQQELERLKFDLQQRKSRVAEIQEMIEMLQREIDTLQRNADDDGSGVREELRKLTNLLTDAEARLVAAKQHLEEDQKTTWDLEDKWKREKSAREACQQRIKQMEMEMPARIEQERIYRQNQEQLKLKLEQSRDKFKADWERAKSMFDNASKGVEQAQAAEAQSDANLTSALAKNQEIQLQVKDTEKMLRATEGLRLEIMARNEALNADLNRLKSQYQVREQLIADLQARIEEDFERWQTAVNTAVQNRKRDGELFNDREKDLHEQLQKLKTERKEIEDDMRSMVLMMEDRRADLTKQRETFDQKLADQRNLSSQLRDQMTKLTQHQQSCETEIVRCRNDMQRADAARKGQEQESSLSEQRRGHIEAEFEMYLRKEQLRMDFVNESQAIHINAMDEVEKAIAQVHAQRDQTLKEKAEIESEIETCIEAISKFQDLDKMRRQRADEFRDKRYDMLEQFTELLIMQDGMRKLIEEVRQPVSKVVSFYNRSYATTAPAKSFNAFEYSDKNLDKAGFPTNMPLQASQHRVPQDGYHRTGLGLTKQQYQQIPQAQSIPISSSLYSGVMNPVGGYVNQNYHPNIEPMYRSGGHVMPASFAGDQMIYRSGGSDLRYSFTDKESLA